MAEKTRFNWKATAVATSDVSEAAKSSQEVKARLPSESQVVLLMFVILRVFALQAHRSSASLLSLPSEIFIFSDFPPPIIRSDPWYLRCLSFTFRHAYLLFFLSTALGRKARRKIAMLRYAASTLLHRRVCRSQLLIHVHLSIH